MNGTTRYLCPLACGWQHDVPDPQLGDLAGLTAAPEAVTLEEITSSIVEQASRRWAAETEMVLRGHLAGHDICTLGELRAHLAGARD
jgi:hypothetical protein